MTLRDELREMLLEHWDPHDVMKRVDMYGPSARTRYDTYIDPLVEVVRRGGGEDEVISFLAEREAESMCFPSLGRERLRLVARKVVQLVKR